MELLEALKRLDHSDDDSWTADGAPRVDVVSELVGAPVTRKDITNAAPDFARLSEDSETDSQEDEEDAAGEEDLEGKVLDMPLGEVTSNEKYCSTAIKVLSRKVEELQKQQKTVAEELAQASAKVNYLTRHHQRLSVNKSEDDPIRAYLDSQNKMRQERAAKAKALAESGVDIPALKKSIDGRSNLDKALAGDRSRGTSRPNHPTADGS